MYDWAEGRREVVFFEGNRGTLVLIYDLVDLLVKTPKETDIPFSMACYLHLGVQYATVMLTFVAALTLFYVLVNKANIFGRNLYMFGHVSGIMWVWQANFYYFVLPPQSFFVLPAIAQEKYESLADGNIGLNSGQG